jgi:hypothetical protein
MKRRFDFEFDDQSQQGTISFDYDESVDERLTVVVENGVPVVYANRPALIFLAKTFLRMALSPYPDGFHVHLNQDLDPEKPEALRAILNETD